MQNLTLIADCSRRRLPVKSVVIIEQGENGRTAATVVYKEKRKRRVSKRWRSIDRAIRRMGRAQLTTASDFLVRHERSNRKKKNGGLRNLIRNVSRSQRKGRKKLKLRFL
jgi:LytS/YehU family sensor histidine kinase